MDILAAIDERLTTLREARAILTSEAPTQPMTPTHRKVGRPKGSVNRKKRTLSPEGRARLVAAVKRRWVAQKKASAGR